MVGGVETFSTSSVMCYIGKIVSEYREILVCEQAPRMELKREKKEKKRLFFSFSLNTFSPTKILVTGY